MSETTAPSVPCGVCGKALHAFSSWDQTLGFCHPTCLNTPTAQPALTEDAVRRIVREELIRSGVVVDRSDDI